MKGVKWQGCGKHCATGTELQLLEAARGCFHLALLFCANLSGTFITLSSPASLVQWTERLKGVCKKKNKPQTCVFEKARKTERERRWGIIQEKNEVYHLCVRLPVTYAISTPGVLLTGVWICFQEGPAALGVQPSGRGCLVYLYGTLSLWHLRGINGIQEEKLVQYLNVLFLY